MYEVDKIVGKRTNPQTKLVQYQVKWVGFPPEKNTWMPETGLKFVKDLIKQYDQNEQARKAGLLLLTNQKKINYNNRFRTLIGSKNKENKLKVIEEEEEAHMDIFQEQEEQEQRDGKIVSQRESSQNSNQRQKSQQKSQNKQQQRQFKKNSSIYDRATDEQFKIPIKYNMQAKKRSLQLSNNQKKEFQKKLQQKIPQISKSILPPLPPDFSTNKQMYRTAQQIVNQDEPFQNKPKSLNYRSTHKQFRKINVNKQLDMSNDQQQSQKQADVRSISSVFSNNRYKIGTNAVNIFKNKMDHSKSQIQGRSNILLSTQSKVIPPPPPPRISLIQPNPSSLNPDLSNQTRNDNTQTSIKNGLTSKITQRNMPSNTKKQNKSNLVYKYAIQNPQYQTNNSYPGYNNNQQQKSIPQNNSYVYEPYQGYNYSQQDYNGYTNAGVYQTSSEPRQLQVYKIMNMEKLEWGFIYYASTNDGDKWLSREDVVPKFSTKLVEFYERFLTFY